MGVDVRELIRNEQTIVDRDENAEAGGNVRMVLFTFVGPEGLIEGGDNQQFLHPIAHESAATRLGASHSNMSSFTATSAATARFQVQ